MNSDKLKNALIIITISIVKKCKFICLTGNSFN